MNNINIQIGDRLHFFLKPLYEKDQWCTILDITDDTIEVKWDNDKSKTRLRKNKLIEIIQGSDESNIILKKHVRKQILPEELFTL